MDNYPMHSFSFDARHDSPDIEVLDYQYGNIRHVGTSANKESISLGESFPATNTSGPMPRGEFLFVKWRIKKTGEIYQDKVDLTARLPANIEGLRVHFVVKGKQLCVYLIWPPDGHPLPGEGLVKQYSSLKQIQIYPDQLK